MKDPIEFVRAKDYKFIEDVGQGGTGKTVLLKDEIINEFFICKKYSPFNSNVGDKYFKNFIDEIKILHALYHRNVVRIFNYYLYPEKKTGYIIMEHIKGIHIDKFVKSNLEKLESIFNQTIEGFKYLEENKILHRDIRPENILISVDNIVKIIDFGFGKKIEFNEDDPNSISLNWRFSIPKEFEFKIYNSTTEVYFLGKLFEEILSENKVENFRYSQLIKEMTLQDPSKRISSFFDVSKKISGEISSKDFTTAQKNIYLGFAVNLESIFNKLNKNIEYITDIDMVVMKLENLYINSMLERYIQVPLYIARCFVKGQFYYNSPRDIKVETILKFNQLLKSSSNEKRIIIMNNLWQRLDKIERFEDKPEDDLPF